MMPESSLRLTLKRRNGRVAALSVHSTRMVQAARLFAGRPAGEVLHLLPAVFALCGTAQALTGLAAMERAAAIAVAPAQRAARTLLILAETVAEHGLTVARDWPALAGAPPRLECARRLKHAMVGLRSALYPRGDWLHPGGGTLAPDRPRIAAALDQARLTLAGLLGHDIEALMEPTVFQDWLHHADATLPVMVAARGWAGFGAHILLPMPELGPPDLSARLATDHDGRYLARPDCAGRVFETGPLAHWHWHPLVADLTQRHGAGLLARLAARLVALASALREMSDLGHDLGVEPAAAAPALDGEGLALTEAARGLLAHRVILKDGRVTHYQILAPTEWNFHPEGPLARALAGAADGPELDTLARLLAQALDPCVACTVSLE